MKRGAMLEYSVSFKKDSITYKGGGVNPHAKLQHKGTMFGCTWLGNNLTVMPCLKSLCLRMIMSSLLQALFCTTAIILQSWNTFCTSFFKNKRKGFS